MNTKQLLDLPQEELEALVRKKLDYLVAEGMVVQIGDKFRLKTQKELNSELADLLAD
jgi:hypothetical protein